MAVAVTRPLHVEYFNVDDVHLVDHLSANLQPEDGLILSPTGAFLVAFYGDWPVTITASDRASHGTMATIGRDRTHYLFRGPSEVPSVERFMAESRPERVWYVGFRTGGTEAQVVEAIEAQGCSAHAVRETGAAGCIVPNVDDRLVSIDRYVAVGIRLPRLDRQRLRRLAGGSIGAAAALSALLFFLSPGAADRTGVRRQVFPDVGFNGAPLRDDIGDAINLDFLNDDPDLPRRFFSARWTGFWYVPEAGDVELHGAGDDRLDVWLDGELVIRRTPPADMHTLVRTLRLDAGVHELRVEYEQHGGAFNMRLEWSPPGGRARPLPPYRLFHERPDTDDVRLAYGVAWLQRLVATLWIAVIGIALAWLATLAVVSVSARGHPTVVIGKVPSACQERYSESPSRVRSACPLHGEPVPRWRTATRRTVGQAATSSPTATVRGPAGRSPFCSDCCSWATWACSAGARSPSTAGSPPTR